MLAHSWTRSLSCLVLAFLAAGCGPGGSDSGGGTGGATNAQPSRGTMEVARDTVQTVVTQAQQVVKKVEETAGKAQALAVQATEQAQTYLDQAKSLLGEKKLQEASGLLAKVGNLTLSPEQQQLFSGLKTQYTQLSADLEKGLADLKTIVAEKKYNEATALVSKLANYQMSAEQQKLYDGLKAELKRLMGQQATEEGKKAVGNLLQGR